MTPAQHPDFHGRSAERDAVSRWSGRLAACAQPEDAGGALDPVCQCLYRVSPLCAPGRASFMSGQLPRARGVYDNAAEFASDIPTYAHHLRRAGYQTCLSGKMHFVGPDQLHGFEERLTTDIYPADFGWTPDYRKPGERIDWWYHNMGSVTGAGVAEISNQMEYDDEVAYHATRKIYDLARGHDARPWCLTVSFTHPHDPYVARKKYWDLYEDCEHLLPEVPAMAYEDHDPHAQRIFDANDWRSFDITEDDIRRSRRAYFANISLSRRQDRRDAGGAGGRRGRRRSSCSCRTTATCWASAGCGSRCASTKARRGCR